MSDSVATRSGRRKAVTRQRLLEAAADVYAGAGVHGATVGAITERADVGLGTFYLHFEDKEAIAVAVGQELLARIAAAARDAAEDARHDDPMSSFRAATRAVCRVAEREGALLHALFRWHGGSARTGALRQVFVDNLAASLERAMAEGHLREEDPRLAAHAVLGLYAESILHWASSGRSDWEALADFLERFTLVGLAARLTD